MLKNYIKLAFKVMLRRKFYTFISLFGIGFTMIVLMVAVSMIDHIFGPHLPDTKTDRTLGVYFVRLTAPGNKMDSNPGYEFLDRYVSKLTRPEKMSFHTGVASVNLYKNGVPVEAYLKRTDGRFWEIFDFHFVEGGPFTNRDEKERNFVAVINEATRRKFFGSQPVVGKFIEADGQRFRVVGVVSNVPFFRIATFSDIWAPNSTAKTDSYREGLAGNFMATVLARNSSDLPAVREEFQSLLPRVVLPREYKQFTTGLDTLFEFVSRSMSPRRSSESHPGSLLLALIGAMILFMILPAVNLININVSRIMERASEIGVRKAFGASSWTLVGQFIVENVLLTLIGGAIGLGGSLAVLRLITISDLIPYAEFHLNYRVFLYGMAAAIFFGVFSGVYPAWKMSRLHPVRALRGVSL